MANGPAKRPSICDVIFFFWLGINTQFSRDGSSPDECHVYSDEIGTPYCVTILDTTLSNGVVTFRSRNTTLQEFLHISEILSTVKRHLGM